MIRKCECCGKELEYYFSGQLYCNNCSVNHTRYRQETSYYKLLYQRTAKKYQELKKSMKVPIFNTKKDVKTYYKKKKD